MGCKGCGKGKKGNIKLAGPSFDPVECPVCGAMAPRKNMYSVWCKCGAYLDVDSRTGKVRDAYTARQMGSDPGTREE